MCSWLMTLSQHELIVLVAIFAPLSITAIGWMLWTVFVLTRDW